jgi:hypothetical protein
MVIPIKHINGYRMDPFSKKVGNFSPPKTREISHNPCYVFFIPDTIIPH